MVKGAREGDLPWDPIWAYVLGEEEEEDRKRQRIRFRKKHDVEPDDSSAGIMSFILPAAYDETHADSFASDQSVDEDAESREHSEKSAVDLVAGIFSWGSDRREGVDKEERKNWLPTILPVAHSELSEKSGDSAKFSEKSDDSKGLRSFLARSKSDSELASKAQTSDRALKLTSTAGKWLGSSAIPSFSDDDYDSAGFRSDSSSALNKKILSVPLFRSDKTKQKDLRSSSISSASATLVKKQVSAPLDKSEVGSEDQIVRIRGLVSAPPGGDYEQPSWDMLGLMSSNDTPQSSTRSRQRNHKSTESDISRKKGLRGMMSGKPKAAKDSTNGETETSKKKDRRGLAMVKSKQFRSEANDAQRSGSQSNAVHPSKLGGGPTTKRESGFKGRPSREVSTSGNKEGGRTTSLTGQTKTEKLKDTAASTERVYTLSEKGRTKTYAVDPESSSKKGEQSVPLEDPPKNAIIPESETMQQRAGPLLFGQKSQDHESIREKHGIAFGRWKNVNDAIDQGRRMKKDESDLEEGIGLSWLFGATSAEEEPKKERRIMTFGRSSSKKAGFHVESVAQESKHKSTAQSTEMRQYDSKSPEVPREDRLGPTLGPTRASSMQSTSRSNKGESEKLNGRGIRSSDQIEIVDSAIEVNGINEEFSLFGWNNLTESPKQTEKRDLGRYWRKVRANEADSGSNAPNKTKGGSKMGGTHDSNDDLIGKSSKTSKSNGDRFRQFTIASKLLGPLNSRAHCEDGKTKDVKEATFIKRGEGHQKQAWLFRKSGKGKEGRDSGKSIDEKQKHFWFSGGTKESEAIQPSSSDTWIWTIDSAIWPTSEKATNTHTIEESAVDKSKRCVHFADTVKPKENSFGWQGGRSLFADLQDWAWQSSSSETCEDELPSWEQDQFLSTNIEDSSEPVRDAPKSESVLNKIFPLWAPPPKPHDETTSSGGSTSESSVTSHSDTTEEDVTTQGNEESTTLEINSPDHDYNEVRLVFQPIAGEEDSEDGDETDIRPFATDQIVMDSTGDLKHNFDDRFELEVTNEIRSPQDIAIVGQENTWTAQFDELPSDMFTATNECIDSSLDGSVRPSRSQLNWKFCRSIMDLNLEQQKLSAQSGVPFHDLSPQKMVTLFPKVKAVSDRQNGFSSADFKDARALGDNSASLKADPHFAGTQSIFEYEYETGVHMFVSYDKFESPSAKVPLLVTVAPVPRFNGDTSEKIDALVQVEASTVSLTDCFIRQGQWWRKDDLPLPNTPGVDFVGKLYRIDATTSKRLGLSVGDRVVSLVNWGGNARFLSVDPTRLVKVPETIDPASAVCLAETYLAAFQVLHQGQRGKLRYRMGSLDNKSILIVGNAVTNIGRAICDIAFDGGATRIYALAEQNHNQELMAIGVSPLTGDTESWRPSLVGDVDCIVCLEENIDPAFYPLLKPNGQAVLVRFKDFVVETSTPTIDALSETKGCWKKHLQIKIVAYNVFEEWENNNDLCIKDLQHLVDLLVQSRITPNVLDRISLSNVARAQELVASARLSGVMVCEPWLIGKSRTVCL